MKSIISLMLLFTMIHQVNSQELPYYEIPENSESYTAGAVASQND